MGCDLVLSLMCVPSPTVVRGVLSTFHGMPQYCSTFSSSKASLLYSLRFRSSLCAAALQTTTENPSFKFVDERTPKKFGPPNGFKTLQTRRSERPLAKLKWYSEILRDCTNDLCLRAGKVVHGKINREEVEPDLHLWVSLINFYAKCGALELSRNVFEQIPIKDVVSWTALISGFVAQGYGIESIELFCEMRLDDVRPNEFTLATVLKGCSMLSYLEFGKQLHADVVKAGVLSDVYIGSALVDLYSKCGEVEYADDVFSMMPEKNAVLWNALLNGHAQMGHAEAVLQLFCGMPELEMRFSNYTLSIVLKGITGSTNFRTGQAVHTMVIKAGAELDDFVSCSLVNMYSKCGLANDALKVFKRIKYPDIVSWSSIISVFDQQGQYEEACALFHLMLQNGVRPNQFTLSSIISAAIQFPDLCYGQSIHAYVHKYGFESDNLVSNALIALYMKHRSIPDAFLIFNSMIDCDIVSWNALLSGFQNDDFSDQGPRIFKQLLTAGFGPNMYTYISILRSCASLLNIEFGKQVHAHIIKDSFVSDGCVGTALIDMYAKCECMGDVQLIFSQLNEKDIFTWTVMIAGYSQSNQGEKATLFFNKMRREGIFPNEFTLASCLRGCSDIASLENGRQLHSMAIKTGQNTDMFVASALIDMYGKCGCIDDADALFNAIGSRDTVLWNTIICVYSQHGQGNKALQAFSTMVNEGVLPDRVTFMGILSACSHMGLVEDGRKLFYSMSECYGITPCIEHYACMVDILGRAGRLDEVESLINCMELTPNALIWEQVLGACRVHGNIELGERAAQKLFQIEPDTDSNYILLSNLYASRGRWDDVSKVRASMSSKGIKKEPGCSWVELNAQVHVFLSQDASHPRLSDIHWKLEELGQKLTEAGYVPDTKYVLRNVTEKEKIYDLSHHSERLALGFALISNIKTRRIRIFKNLRICGDCHEFMKFVSGIIDQEIIVRDSSRFHHFYHGLCSCKDYW